jgi:Peptidase family M1 domain
MTATQKIIACLILLAACSLRLAAQNTLAPSDARNAPAPPHAPDSRNTSFPQIAPAPYWQQQVNYTIDVSLNSAEHTLDGFARIQYINRSPDTLSFIWFHLWPDAYKNDQTAFSEQLLGNGRMDFYFSELNKRGYINRLEFRADGIITATEDHPEYIDIIKIILPRPLPPGGQTEISTPFHEQLPVDFSRSGYSGGAFRVTEWYPQPAVYDRYGWHPLPYLDQGGSYGEYGNFDVRITVPANYTVDATGVLSGIDSSVSTLPSLQSHTDHASHTNHPAHAVHAAHTANASLSVRSSRAKHILPPIPDSRNTLTLRYRLDNVNDFAWFAAKGLTVAHDTVALPSGRVIDVYAYYRPISTKVWKPAIKFLKDAILFRSRLIGEYPYAVASAYETDTASTEALEYPTIVLVPSQGQNQSINSDESISRIIGHGMGYTWFHSALGSNARSYAWMNEGFSTFFDLKYSPEHEYYGDYGPGKLPVDRPRWHLDIAAAEKKDQPLSTPSEDFTVNNYTLIGHYKANLWLRQMERTLGSELFDSCMRQYFRVWHFRHPYPADFRAVFESASHRSLDSIFGLLDKTGPITPFPTHRTVRATFGYSHERTEKYNYINFLPAMGYNNYDQFMIGAAIHNLDRPPNRFQFLAVPLYATNSKKLNAIGGLSYSSYPDGDFRRMLVAVTGSRFSTISGVDSNGKKVFGGFYKIVPTARLTFRKPSARSTLERWIEWKTYLIGESGFNNYVTKSTDSTIFYPVIGKYDFRYLDQLSLYLEDQRVLYPYNVLLQFQQASAWYRINFTGNYFFNYERGGGISVRLFAAKFGYIGTRDPSVDFSTYQPKLTGLTGGEDYTYSNYFLGRSEFTGLASQQIMVRDGGLKIRTDLFQDLQGRSENWVAALNFNSSLPPGLLPPWLPLKVFLDIGTYAEAWHNNPPTSRFLYVAGLQLTPFKYFNIYAPLLYSSDFGDQLKTVPDQNSFFKKISFSIDFQTLKFGKRGPDNPF